MTTDVRTVLVTVGQVFIGTSIVRVISDTLGITDSQNAVRSTGVGYGHRYGRHYGH